MAVGTVEPVEKENLRQVAYRRFKEALFAGRIKPGEFLSQRELCDLLDVPLGPVREALKSLESDETVTLLPKRGIRVIQIDLKSFTDAIDARKLIEGAAAEKFAAEAEMAQIETIADETESFLKTYRSTENPDDALFVEKNRVDFMLHDAMMTFLDNRVLLHAFRLATEHVRIFRLNIAANQRFFELPAIEEHLAIISALKARDAAAAKAALHEHLDGTLKRAAPGLVR